VKGTDNVMALPVISNCFQCSIGYNYGGVSTAANVLHVQAIGIGAQDIADALAATWWQTNSWPAIISNTCSAGQIRVTPLDGTSTTAIATAGSFGTTVGAQDHLTDGLAESLVVTMYSNHRGRSGRGRIYLPYIASPFKSGLGASWEDVGSGISNAFSQYNAYWTTNMAGITRGVVSPLHSAFYPMTFQVVQLGYIGNQRGRLHS
jgi:hypothetical protein